MTPYQKTIREVAPNAGNPAGIEGHMRNQYGTLDHLSRDEFAYEARLAAACEKEMPGYLRLCAAGQGFAADFNEWEG